MRMLIPVSVLLLAAAPLATGMAAATTAPEVVAATPEASAVTSADSISTIRTILHNGNPDVARTRAYNMLKDGHVDDRQRRSLLRIIAIAEEMQSALHDYSDAEIAIAAWHSLLKEFVSPDDAAGIRWKICWLYWKKGDEEGARRAAAEVLKESPSSHQARQARLLLARLDIKGNKLHAARKNLMKFALDSSSDAEQAQGLAWMGVVDFREGRDDPAFNSISKAIAMAPGLVSSDVTLLSTYTQLLYARHNEAAFQRQSARFLELYLDRPEASLIRLLSANMLAESGKGKEAERAYEMLSEVAPETSIGMKAFMRKLMLQYADTTDFDTLKPVLASLHTLAVNNQMSDIEDEAMLDQARLWIRLAGQVDKAEEKALDLYTQVTVGTVPAFAAQARQEGYALFVRDINSTLDDQSWLESIVLWRRYPQLREPTGQIDGDALKQQRHVRLGVAAAMRRLMDFDAAEELLASLYRDTQDSVEGDRIMLEMAKLWLDRRDPDGYARIIRWLNAHSFTMYRPEMLLVAARIQLQNHQPNQASQTLMQVSEQDIAPDMRPDYWLCKAEIAEALGQWHPAAAAWARHNALFDKAPAATLLRRADALFMAGEYAGAGQAYMNIPEGERNMRWQFRMAVCEVRTGQWKQAEERLTALTQNPDAAEYALRARLLLADREAVSLMEHY